MFGNSNIGTANSSSSTEVTSPGLGDPPATEHWFDRARFGLMLTWGLYSILSDPDRREWVLYSKKPDLAEYNRLAMQFTANRFDARQWARLARNAGMGYAVLITRHHDGFCLFDTKTTDFNSVRTGAGRDLVAEYVSAFRSEGLHVGLYHSIMSWQFPAIFTGPGTDPAGWEAMVAQTHQQVLELMTFYGKIDMLWYDGCFVPGVQDSLLQARWWRTRELNAMVRSLQPGILINDRSGPAEDFDTPEQRIHPAPEGRRWESCMTLNDSWSYNIHDRKFKSSAVIKQNLIRCARYGGNLLLGVGPRADGTIQDEIVKGLEEVGQWLRVNGASIYASQRTAYTQAEHAAGLVTQRGGDFYVHLTEWPGPTLRIDGLGHATQVEMLGQDWSLEHTSGLSNNLEISGIPKNLPWEQGPMVLHIEVPEVPQNPARNLGGGDELRITSPDGPAQGCDTDHHAPSPAPVIMEEALRAALVHESSQGRSGVHWCPGWACQSVFESRSDHTLVLNVDIPATNNYQLEFGLIAREAGTIHLGIDGEPFRELFRVRHPGIPDTWRLAPLTLNEGRHQITLASDVPWGIYGFRCSPRWRAVPAEWWWTIGPFHTDFRPQRPVSDVRQAMRQVFPPQLGFNLNAIYQGARGMEIRWTRNSRRQGDYSHAGVNFPHRCGDQIPGVCFARTVIECPEDREAQILFGCDWWLNAYLNEQLIESNREPSEIAADGACFSTWKPRLASIRLRQGRNVLLVKCHPGSNANWFTCYLSDPGDLRIDTDG